MTATLTLALASDVTSTTLDSEGVVDSYIGGVRSETDPSGEDAVGLVFVVGFMLLLIAVFVVVARKAHRSSRGY